MLAACCSSTTKKKTSSNPASGLLFFSSVEIRGSSLLYPSDACGRNFLQVPICALIFVLSASEVDVKSGDPPASNCAACCGYLAESASWLEPGGCLCAWLFFWGILAIYI